MVEVVRKKLVLFDFDGTLTRKDTLFEIIKYTHGRWHFYNGILVLLPYLILYKMKVIPNWKAKEKILIYFFKGMPINFFQEKCNEFASLRLPNLLRREVMNKMEQLRSEETSIAIVSASAENWIRPWCDKQGAICIGTKLNVENGNLTGKIEGENCYGIEKVNRIQQTIDLSRYSEIIAYGDSEGDWPMLKLASQAHYRAFH
jgi:HAD superfamily hydrolase (TIGR01490 family)